MLRKRRNEKKDSLVDSPLLQVYESLPPPQNNKQFSDLLAWLDKDRERIFTYARFSDVVKYGFRGTMILAAAIMIFATSEHAESIKWILKLLSPFLK